MVRYTEATAMATYAATSNRSTDARTGSQEAPEGSVSRPHATAESAGASRTR